METEKQKSFFLRQIYNLKLKLAQEESQKFQTYQEVEK